MAACASAQEADPLNVLLHIGFDGSPAASVPAELSATELQPVAYVEGRVVAFSGHPESAAEQ